MVKKPRAFRLSDTTLDQIEWLKFQLGDVTATDVITIAVAELYDRKKAELPLIQLIELEEGLFDVEVQGETIMRFNEEVFEQLPDEFKDELLAGHAPLGDTFVYLILSLAKGKGQIEYKPEELLENVGLEIDEKKA